MEVMAAESMTIDNELYLQIVGANDAKRFIKADLKPYFFAEKIHLSMIKKAIDDAALDFEPMIETGDYYSLEGAELVKITVDLPKQVTIVRNAIESLSIQTYESDVRFAKRWVLDKKHKLPTNCSMISVDVEVDSRRGFPEPKLATERILSIAAVTDRGKEYFISYTDENRILKEFLETIAPFPIIIGWNLSGFDSVYLEKRIQNLKLNYDIHLGHQWIDLMRLYQFATWNEAPSYALDNIAETELGEHKKQSFFTLARASTLWDAFENKKDLLREYNVGDCNLVLGINKKRELIDGAIHLINKWGSMFFSDFQYMSRAVESLILSEAASMSPRPVFPKKPQDEGADDVPYTGAYIMEPEVGLHRPVVELDFHSFYPTTIQTFRISPENASQDKVNVVRSERLNFKKGNDEPLYTKILNRMIAVRYALKAEYEKTGDIRTETMEHFSKLFSVSFYGTQGNHHVRYYNRDIAESITLTCQAVIKKAIERAVMMGLLTKYSHTDSAYTVPMFASLRDVKKLISVLPKIEQEMNKWLKQYVIETYDVDEKDYKLYLGVKNVYEWLYFMTKNRMKGKKIWDGVERVEEDYSKGLEKSDTFQLLNEVRTTIFNILAANPESQSKFEAEVSKYLAGLRPKLLRGELDGKLITNVHANKKLADYKRDDPHIRAAKKLAAKSLFRVGDVISFVMTNRDVDKNLDAEPIYADGKIPKIYKSGYEYYWQRIEDFLEELLGREFYTRDNRLEQYSQ
jgi:DNA polymerase elongation subunit (family B)